MTTESQLVDKIIEALDDNGECGYIERFEDAGVLTQDQGLVICIGDTEFQVTVVRSRVRV